MAEKVWHDDYTAPGWIDPRTEPGSWICRHCGEPPEHHGRHNECIYDPVWKPEKPGHKPEIGLTTRLKV